MMKGFRRQMPINITPERESSWNSCLKIGFYYTELLLSSLIVSFEPESSMFVLTADGQAQPEESVVMMSFPSISKTSTQ